MNDDAFEDSDEEFAPLESIVPAHLQKSENLKGIKKPNPKLGVNALEDQMNNMHDSDSSGTLSFQIGGHSSKPKKSATTKGERPSPKNSG